MVQAKQNLFDAPTPEQRDFCERMARRREQGKRQLCDMLVFWQNCERPQCRRNRACTGDPDRCFSERWGLLSDDWKEWVRGAIQAKRDGATTVEELVRAADARRAAYFQRMTKYAAVPGAAPPEPAAKPAPAPSAGPGPKIRKL